MLDYGSQSEKPLYQLPTKFHELVYNGLLEDERVLWTGQPDIKRATRITRRILIKFNVFWLAIWVGIVLLLRLLKIDDDSFPIIMGVFIQVILLCLALFAKSIVKNNAPQMAYVLTNHRFLTVNLASDTRIVAFGRDKIKLAKQKLRDEGAGYGSLSYGWGNYKDSEGDAVSTKIGFFHVPQVRQLEQLIQQTFGPPAINPMAEWPQPQ